MSSRQTQLTTLPAFLTQTYSPSIPIWKKYNCQEVSASGLALCPQALLMVSTTKVASPRPLSAARTFLQPLQDTTCFHHRPKA